MNDWILVHWPVVVEIPPMISHRHRFLFIHIPKTGGNSIQNLLAPLSEDKLEPHPLSGPAGDMLVINPKRPELSKHSSLTAYYNAFGWRILFYHRFATMRNPYDKLVSYYFSPHAGRTEFDPEEFDRVIREIPPLGFYVGFNEQIQPPRLLRRWKGDIMGVNALMRFEALQEDFRPIAARFGLSGELPVKNRGPKRSYRDYFSRELRDWVADYHAIEMGMGKYSF